VSPRKGPPAAVVAFDANENSVAVARVSLLSTVDAVAQWNRQYLNPAVYFMKTDFGRLVKRYEAVRNAKLEEIIGIEEKAKKGVKKKVKKRELRHRIKQTPFKKLIMAVEDKARETGSAVFYVSSFRNSSMCPIHFARLEERGDWHALHCPRGHVVDRDAAAVLNMLWKITPEGVAKGVWWDVKEAKKRLRKGIMPKDTAKKRNPPVPWPIVRTVRTSLKTLKAGRGRR
jgi:putative transposase